MESEPGQVLDVAVRIARSAGSILLESYGRVAAREKAPGDLVTDADQASQRLIADEIRRAFPDHTILAEEDGLVDDPARPWRWIVDPLDGTVNFAHGFPLWCVSIGVEFRGEMVAGVVHVPLTGVSHAACRGRGLTVDGRPSGVSACARLSEALVSTGIPVDFRADARRQLALFARFSTGTHSVRRTGTTAWNLAMVASGGCDMYYSTSVHPWDVAAGVALVREGGGVVTDLRGELYRVESPGILASNGRLHDEALAAVREALVGAG